jgi:hypothetical protein
MHGLIWEYYVTSAGFEIRLFRVLLVYRLRKQNMVAAHLVDGMRGLEFGSHPFNTVSLSNRWQRKWVLIEKRCWPVVGARFLGVTPKNPEEFVIQIRTLISSNKVRSQV